MRGYPRHARSLSARALRQRVLLFAAFLVLAAIASVAAVPGLLHHNGRPRREPASHLSLGPADVARAQAASWVRDWVSVSALIACDPLMCQVLASHGLAIGRMQQINPGTVDTLNADVVVATPVVRIQFGARLAQVYAPAVLASFGAGSVRVDVRVGVNVGAASRYLGELHADLAARRVAGLALLRNPDILTTGVTARELASGAVDARLLTNLATLVHLSGPVEITNLGGSGPGATSGMPLLSMSVTPLVRPGRRGSRISLTAGRASRALTASLELAMSRAAAKIMAFLRVQRTPLQPARCRERRLADGQIVIEIDFGAPTQFGVFSGSLPGTTPVSGPPPSRPNRQVGAVGQVHHVQQIYQIEQKGNEEL